jgi:TIGR03009 family protein
MISSLTPMSSRKFARLLFLAIAAIFSAMASIATAQTQGPVAPFQLNPLEQSYLDQVLDKWQIESDKINTFKCEFERWEYNAAFGPGMDIPLSKDKGELSYQKPDKGSFQITQVRRWQADPVPPNGQIPTKSSGKFVEDSNAIGEHWVCDGSAIYEYRQDQKQVVVRNIPKEMQGKAIVNGPLPFLFGADAAKLKDRYWMRIQQQNNAAEIWLEALPKYQADAANYQKVEMILDREKLLPKAMRVHLPNGSQHVYLFDLVTASVNSRLQLLQTLFSAPRTPYGWKRVVEDLPQDNRPTSNPPYQAAQPEAPTQR